MKTSSIASALRRSLNVIKDVQVAYEGKQELMIKEVVVSV